MNYFDRSGHAPEWLQGLAIGLGIIGGILVVGATTGRSIEGILVGVGIGFGGGAIAGTIIGGTVGGIQYAHAVNSWASVESNGRIISSKENMIRHFEKHVVQEHETYLGKNVIEYTKNANRLKKAITSFKTLESGSLSTRGIFAGEKVRIIIDASTKLLLSFC